MNDQQASARRGALLSSRRFQIVLAYDTLLKRRWTIEEVIPGEPPVPLPFFGTRAEAEAEASRLNLHGRKAPAVPPTINAKPKEAVVDKIPERLGVIPKRLFASTSLDHLRCCARLKPRWMERCSRLSKVERAGFGFCGIHDPGPRRHT